MSEEQLDLNNDPIIRSESFMLKYDGPSFLGKMEVSSLRKQINSIDRMTRAIISDLNDKGKISVNSNEVEIYFNAKNGSFEAWYEVLFNREVFNGFLGAFYFLIFSKIMGKTWGSLSRNVKSILEKNGNEIFYDEMIERLPMREMKKIINPMNENDLVKFCSPPLKEEVEIPYREKENISRKIEEIVINAPIIEKEESLIGEITQIDIEHKAKYKFRPKKEQHSVRARFLDADFEDVAKIIGKEVIILTNTHYKAGERILLEIKEYKKSNKEIGEFF